MLLLRHLRCRNRCFSTPFRGGRGEESRQRQRKGGEAWVLGGWLRGKGNWPRISGLCHGRGNSTLLAHGPLGLVYSRREYPHFTCRRSRTTTPTMSNGSNGGLMLVCLQPPSSTYPDSVQIVEDTIKQSPKQAHTHKQIPRYTSSTAFKIKRSTVHTRVLAFIHPCRSFDILKSTLQVHAKGSLFELISLPSETRLYQKKFEKVVL